MNCEASREIQPGTPAVTLLSVLESTTDCVFFLNDRWEFVLLNQRAIDEIAQGRHLIGQTLWDAFPEAKGSAFEQHYELAMSKRIQVRFEAYFGPLAAWYEVQANPTMDGLSVWFRNITERKNAKALLQSQDDRFRLAAKATNDLIWDWNFDTNVIQWGEALNNLFGYELDQFGTDVSWWESQVHPDDRDRVWAATETVLESGQHLSVEYRFRRADGTYAAVLDRSYVIRDGNGKATRMVGAIQDLSRMRETADALAARERQLETVFGQAMVGIMHCGRDGRTLMANDAFCRILGRSADELSGVSFHEYTHPEDLAWNAPMYEEHAKTGAPFQIEKRYIRKDGTSIWCGVSVSFIRDGEGAVQSTLVIAEDISERRRAQEDLHHSRQLLQSVIDGVDDFIFAKDRSGRFILTNRALDEACGNLLGGRTEDFFEEELATGYDEVDHEVVRSGRNRTVDEIIPVRGHPRMFQTVKVPWRTRGEIAGVIGISRDVTERRAAEDALRRSEALNRSIVEASIDCIKLIDLEGKIVFVNDAAVRSLELADRRTLVGRAWLDLWPRSARKEAAEAFKKARKGGVAAFRAEREAASGGSKWWDVVLSPVIGPDGTATSLVTISRDITEQRLQDERVHWSATHDPLTALPNRTLFNSRLSEAILQAEIEGGKVGLLHLDVDHFKQINDAMGHDAGDVLLKTFADRLRKVVRAGDTVARLGGDEFAVVLPRLSSGQDISLIVESILVRMKEPFVYSDRVLDCRASIGASLFPVHGNSPEELLKNADTALYAAKAGGRGGLMVFRPEMRAEMQRRSSMVSLARDALEDNRILPYYQPKVDLRSGCISGFEALLRWRDPNGRLRSPGQISAAFEDLDVATAISEQILKRAVRDASRWLKAGVKFGHVAINAAAAEFRHDNFAQRVLEELEKAGLPTCRLQVEVTETVFVGRGAEHVERALQLLSREGVTIALDDFGTGYASLRHLKQFPVDVIKIDQSFVRDVHNGPGDAAIIDAVLSLGQSLGISTVAEGIETHAQAEHLRRSGCDYGQGYLYSRAIPAERVPGLVRQFFSNQSKAEAA
jgi:diguanylate cyclase (GGDEF)-like protein/PAS domain S-box-containing protein